MIPQANDAMRALVREVIAEIESDIRVVEADLDVKRRIRDFHGVRDACVDIETKEARIAALRPFT